jgi:hypothetical protein
MKKSLRKLVGTALIVIMAAPLCSTEALAGGYHHGYNYHGYRHNNYGGYHGNYYSSNQLWTAVGVGVLGGALIGAASAQSAPVYYQQQPTVYLQPPVYVQQPVYVQPPVYMPAPPTYQYRYDPGCGCLR